MQVFTLRLDLALDVDAAGDLVNRRCWARRSQSRCCLGADSKDCRKTILRDGLELVEVLLREGLVVGRILPLGLQRQAQLILDGVEVRALIH